MKSIFVFALLLTCNVCRSQNTGIFHHVDIGKPTLAGSTKFDKATQTYSLTGAGYNIWFARDEFQYAYQQLTGNFVLTADFEFVGNGSDLHRKIGWMIRTSLDDDAQHVSAVAHGDGLTVLQWRVKKGAPMRDPEDEIFAKEKHYYTIQLERIGNRVTMRAALKGKPLELIGATDTVTFPDEVFAGIFICSHKPDVLEMAQVKNVVISKIPIRLITAL